MQKGSGEMDSGYFREVSVGGSSVVVHYMGQGQGEYIRKREGLPCEYKRKREGINSPRPSV
jgi:hypothetical protein